MGILAVERKVGKHGLWLEYKAQSCVYAMPARTLVSLERSFNCALPWYVRCRKIVCAK
jgi:hypothetical protein